MAFPLTNYGNFALKDSQGKLKQSCMLQHRQTFKNKLSPNTVLIILGSFAHISADATSNLSHSSLLENIWSAVINNIIKHSYTFPNPQGSQSCSEMRHSECLEEPESHCMGSWRGDK